MLKPYRVLDLTDGRAALGPMMLGFMGADVVKVEPPGGAPSRSEPPLDPLALQGMGSLRFQLYNRGKRSVTLDLDAPADRSRFLELVASSHFLFENAAPGAMAARGLGFDDLAKVNPQLVYVATTPFGQDGPYANHAATDLTLAAMGGMMAVNGDADRPPVRITVPQTWLHGGAESAVAAMVAHFRRLQTGQGQFADVSVQACVFWTLLNASIAHWVQGRDIERNGSLLQLGTVTLPVVYPCIDGGVVVIANGASMPTLTQWMVDAGIVGANWLTDEEWKTYDFRWIAGEPLKIPFDEVHAAICAFTARYRMNDLLERALGAGITLAPVNSIAEVANFRHLEARGYWEPLETSPGRALKAPGPFVRLSETPLQVAHAAPKSGEHTAEVLGSLPGPVAAGPAAAPGALPFAGLKVADFSWIGVGPITAKYLGDHGATVVRVETAQPPDRLRVGGPFKDGVYGTNRSQFFGQYNTSKLSLALALRNPEALAIAKRLINWADVVLESFTPGAIAALGLGWDVVRQLNPRAIMVSSCLMGQTGPAAPMAGYGNHAAAISGFYEVTGWPDRDPGGPFAAYTDTIAPHFLASTLMAALDHRRRTGQGQYIEQAQMESAVYFLGTEILDYQLSGRVPRRAGNDEPGCAPHDAFPCAGSDEWCAIAVETNDQWQALRRAMGDPAWARDPAFDRAEGRFAARTTIGERLAEWTRNFEPHDLMTRLQAAGVPAGAVQRSSDLLQDPQLAHRRFFRPLPHCEMGDVPYEGHMFRIRGYDNGPRFAAPGLGEHSVQVLQEILGMSEEEIGEVLASGAIA